MGFSNHNEQNKKTGNNSSVPEIEKCREAALNMLDRGFYTAAEIRNKLSRKGFSNSAINPVITQLQEIGLINDTEYTKLFWEMSTSATAPKGANRIKMDLAKKGICSEIITDSFNELDAYDTENQLQNAMKAGKLKLRLLLPPSKRNVIDNPEEINKIRDKLIRHLANRGFPTGICFRVGKELTQAINDNSDNDDEF